jgi:hypothetical protein
MKQISHISGIVILLLLAYNVCGQNVVFTATASANKMGQRDQIQLTYMVSNADVKSFNKPDLKEFDITQGPFQQNSMNIEQNGNSFVQTKTTSLTFVVHPKHIGNITIPALTAVDMAGHTLTSNKVPIQVVAGSLAPAQPQRSNNPFDDPMYDPYTAAVQRQMQRIQQMNGGRAQQQQQQTPAQALASEATEEKSVKNDIFIKVAVDKSRVHVGEQITASYKLYARIPMQVSISKLPSLNGFWTQDFTIPKVPKPVEEIVDGKKYQVFLLKKSALFPQQDGTLQLDAAEGEGTARIIVQSRQRDPFAEMLARDPAFSMMMNDPMFNQGFFGGSSYRDVKVHLKSTPVKISVTPLPVGGKPDGYSGAVGSFAVSGRISKTDMTTDDAINYTLNISGSGNLKLIETPKLTLPNGLDSYDPTVLDTITGRSTTISGSKIITYAISAHTPGDYDIPAIPFAYYNPETGKYVLLATMPVKLHVKQGKHSNLSAATQQNTTVALKDIHNIAVQTVGGQHTSTGKPTLYSSVYWSLYAFPLFALIGIAVWRKRDEELAKDTVLLRNKRANKVALKRLLTAQKLLQEKSQKPFYEEVSKAIWLYLSDKLNIPLSTLSRESAREAMAKHKMPQALLQHTENIIIECETNLYAQIGGAKAMEHTYAESVELISKLEEIF